MNVSRFFLIILFITTSINQSIYSQKQIGSDIDGDRSNALTGYSSSLSGDGKVLAVGSPVFDKVQVYTWRNSRWSQKGLDIEGELGSYFGASISISEDGNILAVGAPKSDEGGSNSGRVKIFIWNGSNWIQRGQSIDKGISGEYFGYGVSISSDGNIVSAGYPDNNQYGGKTKEIKVYEWDGTIWEQKGETITGRSVSLSGDGNLMAVKSYADNSYRVIIYEWSGSSWNKKGNSIQRENEIHSIKLASEGNVLAIADPTNDRRFKNSGVVQLFEWDGTIWEQKGEDLIGERTEDYSGISISLSANGDRIAIGAYLNDGSEPVWTQDIGHVRVYDWNETSWIQKGEDIDGELKEDQSGYSVSLSDNGKVVSIGAPMNYSKLKDGSVARTGHVRVYSLDQSLPYAKNQSISVTEQTPYTFELNAGDIDLDILTYTTINQPTKGVITIDEHGVATYTSTSDSATSDSFTYKVNDGMNDSEIATINITIANVNDAPITSNVSLKLFQALSIDIELNANDPDGDNLNYSVVNQPTKGKVNISEGIATYTFNLGSTTTDTFTYKVNDGIVDSNVSTVSITNIHQIGSEIESDVVNEFNGYSLSLSKDGSIIAVGSPYADSNGYDSGSVRIYKWDGSSWSQKGNDIIGEASDDNFGISVSLSNNGQIIAVGAPGNDGNGNLSGHVKVYQWNGISWVQMGLGIYGDSSLDRLGTSLTLSSDGHTLAIGTIYHNESSGQVKIYKWNGMSWDQKGDDIDGVEKGISSGFSVSLSDDGDTLAITAPFADGSQLSSGYVKVYSWNSNSWVQMGSDIEGENTGDYFGLNATLSSDGKKIAISAIGYNDSKGQVKIFEWNSETWHQIGTSIYGENAGDLFGYSLSLSSEGEVLAVGSTGSDYNGENSGLVNFYRWNGTSWINENINFTGKAAGDSLGFSVDLSSDGNIIAFGTPYSDNYSGNVQVYAFDQTAPFIREQTVSVIEQTPTVFQLDSGDLNGDPITYTVVNTPINGVVSIDANGLATYTSTSDTATSDSFTYKVNDGTDDSEPATVTITVTAVNDTPTVAAITATTDEDTATEITLLGTDVDGDELTYTTTEPTNGSVSIDGAVVTYTPNANYTGTDSFTYTASDGTLTSEAATVSITITAVNDIPTVAAITATTDEDTATEITLLGTDVDGDELTYTTTDPEHGTIVLDGAVVTYTPNANYTGTDSFTYTASDDALTSEAATVSITVTAVNDAPEFSMDAEGSILENAAIGAIIASLEANDVDGDELTFSLSDNSDDIFAFSEGSLVLNQVLDYESITNHSVTITVSDGVLTDTLDFTLNVVDVPNNSVEQEYAITVYDVENEDNTEKLDYTHWTSSTENTESGDIIFEISGGEDAALFTIDPVTGALDFIEAPDYENPSDTNGDNVYIVIVKITNINDGAPEVPVITNQTTVAVPEAQTAAADVDAINTSDQTDTDEDGVVDTEDNCPTTYNPGQEDMDGDGVGDVCDDSDMDTFFDAFDECPSSTYGVTVNAAGCETFSLPVDTFSVSVTSATCPDSSNGSITISSSNTEYSYRYAIDNQAPQALTDNTQTISNLSAGIYTVCITVDGVSDYQRCYTIEITEPAPLVASSRIDMSSRNLQLDLSGSEEYQVTLNGKTFLTSKDKLSLNLEPGMNRVEVATALDCQGVYFEEIFVSEEVKVYPNPTKGPLQLFVAGSDREVELNITTLSGNVIKRETLSVPANRIIETSLGNLPEGLYLITLNGTTVKTTHKVIKE